MNTSPHIFDPTIGCLCRSRRRHRRWPSYPRVIGLSGRMRTGKDTAAEHLSYRYGYTRVAFADPLKSLALEINPLIGQDTVAGTEYRLRDCVDVYGWDAAKEHPEVRRTLQELGRGVRDVLGYDIWVRHLRRILHADALSGVNRHFVVTDVRYPNEADEIRRNFGVVVRLERNLPTGGNSDHESETSVDEIEPDVTILNDGTIAELHEALDDLMIRWKT